MLVHRNKPIAPLPSLALAAVCRQGFKGREGEVRREIAELTERHAELKRKFRRLYVAYRHLRYQAKDVYDNPEHKPHIAHEDEILGTPPSCCLFRSDGRLCPAKTQAPVWPLGRAWVL